MELFHKQPFESGFFQSAQYIWASSMQLPISIVHSFLLLSSKPLYSCATLFIHPLVEGHWVFFLHNFKGVKSSWNHRFWEMMVRNGNGGIIFTWETSTWIKEPYSGNRIKRIYRLDEMGCEGSEKKRSEIKSNSEVASLNNWPSQMEKTWWKIGFSSKGIKDIILEVLSLRWFSVIQMEMSVYRGLDFRGKWQFGSHLSTWEIYGPSKSGNAEWEGRKK